MQDCYFPQSPDNSGRPQDRFLFASLGSCGSRGDSLSTFVPDHIHMISRCFTCHRSRIFVEFAGDPRSPLTNQKARATTKVCYFKQGERGGNPGVQLCSRQIFGSLEGLSSDFSKLSKMWIRGVMPMTTERTPLLPRDLSQFKPVYELVKITWRNPHVSLSQSATLATGCGDVSYDREYNSLIWNRGSVLRF